MDVVLHASMDIRLLNLIGEGGMGKVYRAVACGADGFEKVVAVKTLSGDAIPETIARMIREAKLVSGLVHVNIVQIYQFARCGGDYFIVMEFVDGISLHDFIEFHRAVKEPIPYEYAAFICDRAARALAYAHSRCDRYGVSKGIVHCDVCPRNIMISKEGVVKLADFGIARGKGVDLAYQETKVYGKAAYMSPEQAAEQEPDSRSDIYSLGMVFFEMLSGGHRARGNDSTPLERMVDLARLNVINWNFLPKDLPMPLQNTLHLALATDPDERYSSAAIFAADLERYNLTHKVVPNICALADYMANDMPARFGQTRETNERTVGEIERTLALGDNNEDA